jgi:hypothetical protein
MFSSFGCAAMLAIFLKNASNTELKNPKYNFNDKFVMVHINLSVLGDQSILNNLINDPDIDVLSFQEYTPDWAIIIPKIAIENFKYKQENVRVDLYGKALYSKYPIQLSDYFYFGEIPNIDSKIIKNNKTYRLVSTYMTPALDRASRLEAKNQFKILGQKVIEDNQNTIVSGEFNQVYWSNDILTFRNKSGLLNTRRNVNPSKLQMPYNHIFYSSDLECFQFSEIYDKEGNQIGCMASFQLKKSYKKSNK